MGVVGEDDDPVAALARVREQRSERGDDALRIRVGKGAGDEVVEHVDDHESLHAATFRRGTGARQRTSVRARADAGSVPASGEVTRAATRAPLRVRT